MLYRDEYLVGADGEIRTRKNYFLKVIRLPITSHRLGAPEQSRTASAFQRRALNAEGLPIPPQEHI